MPYEEELERVREECDALISRADYQRRKINSDDNIYKTSLVYAILFERFDVAKQLISFGADVSVKNDLGQTALQYAVTNVAQSTRMPNPSDVQSTTMSRCRQNLVFYKAKKVDCAWSCKISLDAVNLKIIKRVQRNGKAYDRAGRLSLVKTLLQAGADVNNKDYRGGSPIQSAVYTGDVELVRTLIEAGADINSRNEVGATPLHDAVLCSDEAMVILLVDHGARVNAKTLQGNTPLHWAGLIYHMYDDTACIIAELLDCPDFDLNSPNAEGRTPYHYVVCNLFNDPFTQELCMDHKADVNAKDMNGATPLSLNIRNLLDPKLPALPVTEIKEKEIIIEQVIEIEARTKKPVFDDYNLAVIGKNPAFKTYYEKCRAELEAMKKSNIKDTSLTYLNILTDSFGVLARHARNQVQLKLLLQDFQNHNIDLDYKAVYPIYGSRLMAKLGATAARREIVEYKLSKLDQVSSILSRMMQFYAEDVFSEIIFKYLSKADIERLIK